jgi:hypothetical protein
MNAVNRKILYGEYIDAIYGVSNSFSEAQYGSKGYTGLIRQEASSR